MTNRHAAAVAAAVLLTALALGGCSSTDYHALVAGSGVTTPSTGPAALGPIGAAGHVSLEGSITQNVAPAAGSAPVEGAGEARAMTTVARARVSYALPGNVELGISGSLADPSWSSVTARGTVSRGPDARALGGGGFQVRGLVAGDADLGFGLLGEVAIYQAPYGQRIDLTTVTHYFVSGSSTRSQVRDVSQVATLFEPQVGAFGAYSPARSLRLVFGVTGGLRNEVRTAYREEFSCTSRCDDTLASPFALKGQLTGFLSAGYELGPVTLLGQVAVNAFGDTPFGATLGVRVTP